MMPAGLEPKSSFRGLERKGSFGRGSAGGGKDFGEFAHFGSGGPRQRLKTNAKSIESPSSRHVFDPDMVRVDHLDVEPKSVGPVGGSLSHTPKRHDAWVPSMHAPDLVDRTSVSTFTGGSLVSRLVEQPAPHNRLGRLLNQLQVLGMDKAHLARLERQLIAAVGDDSGKKLRLLQQAVHRLVTDRSYPALPTAVAPPEEEEIDPEEGVAAARSVTTYEPTGYAQWIQEEDAVRPDETRLRPKHFAMNFGDSHNLMHGGVMQRPEAAVEALFEREVGKPMLSAAVTMEMPDYIGDTQLDLEDRLNNRFRLLPKQEEQTVVTSKADQFRDLRNVQKARPKKEQSHIMAGIHHPHENAKAEGMRKNVFNGGRCYSEQEGRAPCPGTDFWRSFVMAATDASKSGSCGGNMLLPPLQIQIPESICLSDLAGGTFMGFYTDVDGFIYRGTLQKDAASEWLNRMRRARLRKMSRRKQYTPMDKEPLYVCRFKQAEAQANEVRSIMTEQELRSSMNEANPLQVTLWQGFIRSRGNRAKIHRVVYNFDGAGEDTGHYMLSSTTQMGARDATQAGFYCLSNDLEGSKATGRATVINNVQPGALPDQVDAAVQLALFALHTFPFRKDLYGKLRQRFPRFAAERVVADWLVDREGVWYFSQVYVFRAKRLQANGGVFRQEKGQADDDVLAETISLLEKNLDYIKVALDAAAPPTKAARVEHSRASLGSAPFPEASSSHLTGGETPSEEASDAGAGNGSERGWAGEERLMASAARRSKSRESVLSRAGKKAEALEFIGASNVHAPPLSTICRLATNPRMQRTGSRLLRDVVVDRVSGDRTYTRAQTATPAGGGRAMARLDRQLNMLMLSGPDAPNPIADASLQRRLGGASDDKYDSERPGRAQSAMPRSQNFRGRASALDPLLGASQRVSGSRPPRPVSAAAVLSAGRGNAAAMTELKNSITTAASALGHPI